MTSTMRNRLYTLLLFLLPLCAGLYAQPMNKLKKADEFFEQNHYRQSIPLYHEVLDELDHNPAKIRLAEAYLRIGDYKTAAQWYGLVVGLPESQPGHKFRYAMTLLWTDQCEEAERWFQEYLKFKPYDERKPMLKEACRYYEELKNKYKNRIVIHHLNINSPVNDYAPAIYREGLVFTSTLDNQRTNLYYSKQLKEDSLPGYANPISFSGSLNTADFHEGIASFNNEQDQIFFTRTRQVANKYKIDGKSPLEITSGRLLPQGNWSELKALPISSDEYSVAHPSISPDGSRLFFSSNMPGGFGGKDLYLAVYEDGQWGPPINLGPTINSPEDEVFPAITEEGKLYFSSNGHLGMGAQDIYWTQEDENGLWQRPQNMGFPLNSESDDFAITFRPDGAGGFFTSNREGGFGGDDIYSFEFKGSLVVLDIVNLKSSLPVAKANVLLGCREDSLRADSNGQVFTYLSECCQLEVVAQGYEPKTTNICEGRAVKDMPDTLYLALALQPIEQIEVAEKIPEVDAPVIPAAEEPSYKALEEEIIGFETSKRSNSEEKLYLLNVYYEVGRSSVSSESVPELKRLLEALKSNPSLIVEIQSHTDSNGGSASNLRLSQRRADAIVRYLLKRGINGDRLIAKGYGETKLVNDCTDDVLCSEAEHQENRRTEFKVVGKLR